MHETLYALLGGNLSEDDLEKYFTMFMEKQGVYYETATQYLLDDALLLIESCRKAGLKQVLVTNRQHARHGNASPHYIVASTVLKDAIHHVLTGDEVEFRKPDARVLESYMKENKLKPDEILVIGDQFVDAQLALNLGTRAILVGRQGHIVNLDKLSEGWEPHITIVPNLHEVSIFK